MIYKKWKLFVIHQAGDAQQLQIEVLMPKRLPSYLLILTSTMYRLLPKKVFALEEIVAAHQYVESSAGYGKVVVRIS